MSQPKLLVVSVSTRPGRKGPAIARWFESAARADGRLDVTYADLAELGLPLLDEPNHPRLRQYTHEHTKRWSALVDATDAFVFVMPEYNYVMPPSMVNAVDYLFHEWRYKAAGLVTYGGMSGGLRAAQTAKQLLTTVGVMPAADLPIPMFTQHLDEQGGFVANEQHVKSARSMLDELHKWATALKTMRA